MTRRVFQRGLMVMAILAGVTTTASAQSFGLRAGVSGDPDQFYAGVHLQTREIADRIHFRPNLEVGVGNDLTLVTANLEFVFRKPLTSSAWDLYAGGGPSAIFYSHDRRLGHANRNDVGGGLNVLLGAEHQDGLFAELKVGLIDSPSVKFGVGFSFGR